MTKKERLDPELVKDFVNVSHADLDKVGALLDAHPELLNAAWDWGGGDWETALGAAAHMGRADIARFLLSHGARIDLFAAAMLGDLAVIQATLTTYPDALHVPGPHGIPLIAHAKAGGGHRDALCMIACGSTASHFYPGCGEREHVVVAEEPKNVRRWHGSTLPFVTLGKIFPSGQILELKSCYRLRRRRMQIWLCHRAVGIYNVRQEIKIPHDQSKNSIDGSSRLHCDWHRAGVCDNAR